MIHLRAADEVRGLRMAYAEAGGEAPLLLVHGFPLDSTVWEPQLKAFGSARRVLAPDLAGFGSTGGPGRQSLDEHADDLAALLDSLGIPRVILAGLSMGGYIAFAMWRRHPERIAGLVLADTRAAADTPEARQGRMEAAANVEQSGTSHLVEGMLPKMLGPNPRPDISASVSAIMTRQGAAGVATAVRAIAARPDSTGDLPGIHIPTLVVVGAEDKITPLPDAEAMVEALPDARLAVIPGAGHLANFEEPGAFNGAVRTFLEELASREGAAG